MVAHANNKACGRACASHAGLNVFQLFSFLCVIKLTLIELIMLAAEVPSAETIDSGMQMKISVMGTPNGKCLSWYSLRFVYFPK